MGGFRLVQKAFIADGRLYGPGRAYFGSVYDWWITAKTLPDDPGVAPAFVQFVGPDGIAAAFDHLTTWQRTHG
jgi:hypothetical protein